MSVASSQSRAPFPPCQHKAGWREASKSAYFVGYAAATGLAADMALFSRSSEAIATCKATGNSRSAAQPIGMPLGTRSAGEAIPNSGVRGYDPPRLSQIILENTRVRSPFPTEAGP
ncbi:uncharacterized protein Triagg1_10110 [Trichoderma aggressivum f. europaeum]|uniref:Uncharacterized protein n=1 Tax=Trichoderma aggressivum f. europaeum TaxID=173218 RepID=A0AAE1LYF2_9HYPO|nr:hypothetical protein Triagg1_10110 [Trichoderma aggressivum f. europaeum]